MGVVYKKFDVPLVFAAYHSISLLVVDLQKQGKIFLLLLFFFTKCTQSRKCSVINESTRL